METRSCIRGCLPLALALTVLACTGMFANYGRFSPSDEVYRAFTTSQMNKDFRYYVTGADLHPNALLGLHRSVRLDPETLWREVQMTPERMKEIVRGMDARAAQNREYHKGFELIDSTGRPIGVWYSLLRAQTFVRTQPDGSVRIDTPALETYERRAGSLLMDNDR